MDDDSPNAAVAVDPLDGPMELPAVELVSAPEHYITQAVPMSGWCLLACRCGWATYITPSPSVITKTWDKHRRDES